MKRNMDYAGSFPACLDQLPLDALLHAALDAGEKEVDHALLKESCDLWDVAALLSPHAAVKLELLAQASRRLTMRRFGKMMQLYAPLYVSNECIVTCAYCGFSRENKISRLTLKVDEAVAEARHLVRQGFRHLLLVSGEHPKYVSVDYLCEIVTRIYGFVPSIAIEVAPATEQAYRRLIECGVDGLVVYQETYDRGCYAEVHRGGPKMDFDRRLETAERGARAGMRRIGIGALLGLSDWRMETLSLVAHARFLMKKFWRTQITVSLPRLRPAAGAYAPPHPVTDRELAQMICVLRLALPDAGIVLSTRESPGVRDGLARMGVTQMSAGSKTEPGGYLDPGGSEQQFAIEDNRSPREVVRSLRRMGLEPVWKDWDSFMHGLPGASGLCAAAILHSPAR